MSRIHVLINRTLLLENGISGNHCPVLLRRPHCCRRNYDVRNVADGAIRIRYNIGLQQSVDWRGIVGRCSWRRTGVIRPVLGVAVVRCGVRLRHMAFVGPCITLYFVDAQSLTVAREPYSSNLLVAGFVLTGLSQRLRYIAETPALSLLFRALRG